MAKLDYGLLIEKALTLEGSIGNTYNRFYSYSYMNQILLMLQGVNEPVATYKKWLELGRQVKKGSKAKEVVRPYFKKDDEGEETINGFGLSKCLFGLSETTGEELPVPEIKAWSVDLALSVLDIEKIEFTQANGNIQGYSKMRQLAINPLAVNYNKTLMHELAHIVLGHTEATGEEKHRGVLEFEAEATAYLLMHELELVTDKQDSTSRAYIQIWLSGQKPKEENIKAIFKAVDKILKAGKE